MTELRRADLDADPLRQFERWYAAAGTDAVTLATASLDCAPSARTVLLKGADGRSYTFRAIDKDPRSVLPPQLQDTWVRNLVQDQIAASHPAGYVVADSLLDAAGVLHVAQQRMCDV